MCVCASLGSYIGVDVYGIHVFLQCVFRGITVVSNFLSTLVLVEVLRGKKDTRTMQPSERAWL